FLDQTAQAWQPVLVGPDVQRVGRPAVVPRGTQQGERRVHVVLVIRRRPDAWGGLAVGDDTVPQGAPLQQILDHLRTIEGVVLDRPDELKVERLDMRERYVAGCVAAGHVVTSGRRTRVGHEQRRACRHYATALTPAPV